MGYKIYREVLDRAPTDWTPAERLIALIIADSAGDDTRKAMLPVAGEWRTKRETGEKYWQDGITERSGLTSDAVRRVFQRLAERGFEFRVPMKTGSDGRPVFAAKGHSLDFLVPPMPESRPRESPGQVRDRSTRKAGTTVPPYIGGTTVPAITPKAGRQSAKAGRSSRPSPQVSSQTSSPQEKMAQERAPRRARTSGAGDDLGPQKIITEVRRAAVDAYGNDAAWLTDEHCAAMYRRFCCGPDGNPRQVGSIRAYLTGGPFRDIPDLAAALKPKSSRPKVPFADQLRWDNPDTTDSERIEIVEELTGTFGPGVEPAVEDMIRYGRHLEYIVSAVESGRLQAA